MQNDELSNVQTECKKMNLHLKLGTPGKMENIVLEYPGGVSANMY